MSAAEAWTWAAAELYIDQQLSATQVGLLVGLSVTSVLHRLHQQGVPVRAPGLPRHRRSQHSGRQARVLLRELYEDSQIRAVLQRHGVRLVDPDDWQPPGPNQAFAARPLDRTLLAELYEELGLSAWHIELLCGVSQSNVLQQLHRHAITVRTGEGPPPHTPAPPPRLPTASRAPGKALAAQAGAGTAGLVLSCVPDAQQVLVTVPWNGRTWHATATGAGKR